MMMETHTLQQYINVFWGVGSVIQANISHERTDIGQEDSGLRRLKGYLRGILQQTCQLREGYPMKIYVLTGRCQEMGM